MALYGVCITWTIGIIEMTMKKIIKRTLCILLTFWIAKQTSGMLWDTAQSYLYPPPPSFTVVRMSEGMSVAEMEP